MTLFFAILTGVLSLWSVRHNCQQIRAGTTRPVLAMWVIFAAANTLAVVAYFSDAARWRHPLSAVSNILWTILSWVLVRQLIKWHDGARKIEPIHWFCLAAAGVGVAVWGLTDGTTANFCFQGVLLIAYIPTWHRLWISADNTEATKAWWIVLGSGSAGLIPPLLERDLPQIVYGVRSVVCSLLILTLIARIKMRARAATGRKRTESSLKGT